MKAALLGVNEVRRKFLLLFILVCCFFFASGCWDRRELGDLGIVAGFALDWEEQDRQFILSAQLIKPTQVRSPQGGDSGGGGGGEKAFWVAKNKADTIFKGVRGFTFESSRRLYFPHNQIVVIGKKAAERGVGPLLDFFLRDAEPRLSEWILIAQEQGVEVLEAEAELETIPAIAISRLLENYANTSEIAPVTLWDFTSRLLSESAAPYAPLIRVEGEGEKKRFKLYGTAVFKKDQYLGELNKRETRGMLWALGEVDGGILTVDYGDGQGRVDVEILKSSAKIVPELKGGVLRMRVEIKAEGNLGVNLTPIDFSQKDLIRDLNAKQAQVIKAEVESALKKARTLQADIFAFGEAVHRKYPKDWERLEKRWTEIFPRIEVEIKVQTNLRLLGLITRPVILKTE